MAKEFTYLGRLHVSKKCLIAWTIIGPIVLQDSSKKWELKQSGPGVLLVFKEKRGSLISSDVISIDRDSSCLSDNLASTICESSSREECTKLSLLSKSL